MNKQLPNWLFAVIIVAFTVGFIGLLGTAVTPPSGPQVGKTPSDFVGKTIDGKPFRLSDHRGKVVLVNFWATWCGPCLMEIPDLIKLQSEFGDKGLLVIGLSGDDNIELVKEFARAKGVNYPLMLVPPGVRESFGNPQGIPASFLLDRKGKIVWQMEGVDPQRSPYGIISEELKKVL